MKFYRFRSMDYLLGDEYQELENQDIYFASPDELNDPMEGFRDIVWSGDKIVWTNLFRNYIYCLHASDIVLRITDASEGLDVDNIPIPLRWNQPVTLEIEHMFNEVWRRLLYLPEMEDIIDALSNTNRKIRYGEMEFYFRVIQFVHCAQAEQSNLKHSVIPEYEKHRRLKKISNDIQQALRSLLALAAKPGNSAFEEAINTAFQQQAAVYYSQKIDRLLKNPNRTGQLEILDQLFFDFPKKYLAEVENLLWPKWYAACFAKDYYNSSVWGHYGDKHRGACLIFESIKTGESNGLNLYHEAGQGLQAKRFYEVDYADKPGEVDFFRSIGQLTGDELKKLWYTDDEGNESECGKHVQPNGATFVWQQSYWDRFYHDITTKTKVWEYEQEYRLILNDVSGEYDDKENRKLIYDFSSLKGIIFGIRTSDENKLRVIEILVDKCKENDLTDFKFYQAYYSPEAGDIRKYEIQLS